MSKCGAYQSRVLLIKALLHVLDVKQLYESNNIPYLSK